MFDETDERRAGPGPRPVIATDDLDARPGIGTAREEIDLEGPGSNRRCGQVEVSPARGIAKGPVHPDHSVDRTSPGDDGLPHCIDPQVGYRLDPRDVAQDAGSQRTVLPATRLAASALIASRTARFAAIAVVSAWS